jgi:hypothetical protein
MKSCVRHWTETGFEEIEMRTAARIARIASKRTSGPNYTERPDPEKMSIAFKPLD